MKVSVKPFCEASKCQTLLWAALKWNYWVSLWASNDPPGSFRVRYCIEARKCNLKPLQIWRCNHNIYLKPIQISHCKRGSTFLCFEFFLCRLKISVLMVPDIGKHKQKHWALRSLTWRKKTRIMTTKSHTSHTTTFQPQIFFGSGPFQFRSSQSSFFSVSYFVVSPSLVSPLLLLTVDWLGLPLVSLTLARLTIVGLALVGLVLKLVLALRLEGLPSHKLLKRAPPAHNTYNVQCATKQIRLQLYTAFRSTLSFCCSL